MARVQSRRHRHHERAHRHRGAHPRVSHAPAGGSIAAENARPGTASWRLPGGGAADAGGLAVGPIAGYVTRPAVLPGQIERIDVTAPGASTVTIAVYRMGWYGGLGGRLVLGPRTVRARVQPPCAHDRRTGLTVCRWRPTLSFRVPQRWLSGVYIARLSDRDGASDSLFVVRALRPTALLVQLPTSTYQAYNGWGGDSLYPGGAYVRATRSTQGVEVSDQRPYGSVTGAGQFFTRDVATVRFLERYGYPVSYTTTDSVDADPAQLLHHRAVIDPGHSEYWSQRQLDAFTKARDAGVSLLFLSSDTSGWRVRYSDGGHTLTAYKQFVAFDPETLAPSGLVPGGGAALTGTAYLGCITPRLPIAGPPTYRYYPWRPSPGLRPRWLFAGTGITAATRIPGIVGYELDQTAPGTPFGTTVVGGGRALCMGTSRAEAGEPVPVIGENLAQTTLYTARSGALVFSSGTLGWELGLSPVTSASPDAPRGPDPRLVALTRNLLAHVLGHPSRTGRQTAATRWGSRRMSTMSAPTSNPFKGTRHDR